MNRKVVVPFVLAAMATLPGLVLRMAGVHLDPPLSAIIPGVAILGASFLLLWACDAAQADISQALALAIVALIAVLPEYAVDMYFTWQAGQDPQGDYAQYAIANMTGANRLLIGVAWGVIAAICLLRFRKDVRMERSRRTELLFLGMATAYAFVVSLKGTLAWYDGLVFLGLFAWYIKLTGQRPKEEGHVEGPAELLVRLPALHRRSITAAMFIYAAGVILANAQPFCEGLLSTGRAFHINEFLLVQWLAPIASEAPEFTVAIIFAWRGQANVALASLLSAKLNQWTLLVGMIPAVFAVSSQTLAHPIPMGNFQMQEILLTAAQSLLAVVLLASLRFSFAHALLLFALFFGQLVLPSVAQSMPGGKILGISAEQIHPVFSWLYVTSAVAVFVQRPRRVFQLVEGFRVGKADRALPQD